ncbi:MAG: S-methyl-5'-thioadenosine phosphorylase [Anaerolineae bacterium]|nr:S-methyl-5'-thioadenosine phosphorylase [Anaerolineae bacterium]
MSEKFVLGVIGGSGLYNMTGLSHTETLEIDTPFGKPSAPIITGQLSGKRVAFLARHGIGHILTPTEVNYRANIYAFKKLGVERIVSVSACGSLREDYAPGHIVIPDQLFDHTHHRARSFFGEGLVVHVSTADPFCPTLSGQLYEATRAVGGTVHRGGGLITIEGPRFSTRAESNIYRSWGLSLIGMTASPEAFLAREAEMCFAIMTHVTDYDVWHVSEAPVTVEMVIRTLLANTSLAQNAVANLVNRLADSPDCTCQNALADAIITSRDHISTQARRKYALLVDKYLPS